MRGVLHHFSEDPTIRRFVPHVPASNPTQAPAVWAIDTEHAPLYWFPRECPRVTVWPRDESERPAFEERFGTTAPRLHAVEAAWLERMRTVDLYRYDLPATTFRRWDPCAPGARAGGGGQGEGVRGAEGRRHARRLAQRPHRDLPRVCARARHRRHGRRPRRRDRRDAREGPAAAHAACAGVYAHVRAGQIAAGHHGPDGVIASDVIRELPAALTA